VTLTGRDLVTGKSAQASRAYTPQRPTMECTVHTLTHKQSQTHHDQTFIHTDCDKQPKHTHN